jgi:hypothetical protein
VFESDIAETYSGRRHTSVRKRTYATSRFSRCGLERAACDYYALDTQIFSRILSRKSTERLVVPTGTGFVAAPMPLATAC